MNYQSTFKRYELKYILTKQQKEQILQTMQKYMKLDNYGRTTIRNIYFDTQNFLLARRSLEKPVYKEKLRVRSYGTASFDSQVFVELKKKYLSVVYKRRISIPQNQAMACIDGRQPWQDSQIGRELAYTMDFYQSLSPAVFLSYERDSFRGVEDEEFRVTFDSEIRYRQEELTLDSDTWGTPILPPGHVLIELKVAGGLPLWMAHVLSEQGIFKTSFSKYVAAYQDIMLTRQRGEIKYA